MKKKLSSLVLALSLALGVSSSFQSVYAEANKVEAKPQQYILSFGDSGAGGLIFALDAYKELLPYLRNVESKYNVEFVVRHIGDTKNAPYGSKQPAEIETLTKDFVCYMGTDQKSNIAVVACNTASTVFNPNVDSYFERNLPNTKVMPIIKKSAETLYKTAKVVTNKEGKKEIVVGVLATPATVASGQYQKALDEIHAREHGKEGVELHTVFYGPKNWVADIEHGAPKAQSQKDVETDLTAMLKDPYAKKMTAVGLFCTHYPFFQSEIRQYLQANGIKNPILIPQGKIFADKIKGVIDADVKAGKFEKRAVALNVRNVPHPKIYSDITGDNMEEIKNVVRKIAPKMLDQITFSKVELKKAPA